MKTNLVSKSIPSDLGDFCGKENIPFFPAKTVNLPKIKITPVRVAATNELRKLNEISARVWGIFLKERDVFQQKDPSLDFFGSFFIKEKRIETNYKPLHHENQCKP